MRGARLVPLIRDCVAMNGHMEIVTALLAAGANVNAVENDGETPLHKAALSTRAGGERGRGAAPHARRCVARTAREAAH